MHGENGERPSTARSTARRPRCTSRSRKWSPSSSCMNCSSTLKDIEPTSRDMRPLSSCLLHTVDVFWTYTMMRLSFSTASLCTILPVSSEDLLKQHLSPRLSANIRIATQHPWQVPGREYSCASLPSKLPHTLAQRGARPACSRH